jgi:polyhydroxyalkanoate synthesis regulator phasin
MDKDEQEQKKFLEEQVEWCKKQDGILEEIEEKLYEMKELAKYARDHELTSLEIDKLNGQLNVLKREVHFLEKQLQSVIH